MIHNDKEVCITAAVMCQDGEVFRCHRHFDGERAIEKRGRKPSKHGFVTSRGRFVNRKEGRRLQEAAGIPSDNPDGYRLGLLFSEDIYWAPVL